MADATTQFFDDLAQRGNEPSLGRTRGSLRFDLADGSRSQHWLVKISNGDIDVSRGDARADCVIRSDQDVFETVLSGDLNAMVAYLRGLMVLEGDVSLLVRFQRLFPPSKGQAVASGKRSVSRQRS
jgi:putative sterol carrier protein